MVIANPPALGYHAHHSRVEKYRPDSLDDVSGHQDILATINKFVDTNVYTLGFHAICHGLMNTIAITTPATLWPTRHRQNINSTRIGTAHLWQQKYEADGVGAQC